MDNAPHLRFREDILGIEQPAGSVRVTEEIIRRYAAILAHPLPPNSHGEPLEAPVALLNLFFTRNVPIRAEVHLEGATVGVNAGRSIEILEKVYAGDAMDRTAVLREVFVKTGRPGAMAFEVWEILFHNQHGLLVARGRDSVAYRPPWGRGPRVNA